MKNYDKRILEKAKNLRIIDDALFRLIATRKEVCQEILRTLIDDDIKRVRFHASLITANHTPKGTSFKNIPNVKVLYITEYDALGNGQAVTHISRCQLVKKTYKPIDDGEDIIFANTKSRQRNKQAHLLKLFLRSDSFYDEMYPELSSAMKHFKDTKKGRDDMCKSIEEFAIEESIDTAIQIFIDWGKSLEETLNYVSSKFSNTSKDYITARYHALSEAIQ